MKVDGLDTGVKLVANLIGSRSVGVSRTKKEIYRECEKLVLDELALWKDHNNGHTGRGLQHAGCNEPDCDGSVCETYRDPRCHYCGT